MRRRHVIDALSLSMIAAQAAQPVEWGDDLTDPKHPLGGPLTTEANPPETCPTLQEQADAQQRRGAGTIAATVLPCGFYGLLDTVLRGHNPDANPRQMTRCRDCGNPFVSNRHDPARCFKCYKANP